MEPVPDDLFTPQPEHTVWDGLSEDAKIYLKSLLFLTSL